MFSITDEQFAYLLILPVLIFAVFIVAYPLAFSFWISVHDVNYIVKLFEYVGGKQYARLIWDPLVLHGLSITLRFVVEVVVLSISIGMGAALLLNQSIPGRGIIRAIVILPWAVSEYGTGLIFRYIYSSEFGFINGVLAAFHLIGRYVNFLSPDFALECVSIAYSWHFAPLVAFFILAALQTIPEDLYRAAQIDGAGAIRRFWNVTLPYVRYALLISLILASIEAARATDIIMTMTGGGPTMASETLTFEIYRITWLNFDMGYGSAVSYFLLAVIMALMIGLFTLLTRRR